MTDLRKAAEMALEALGWHEKQLRQDNRQTRKAIEALRQALAQPEQEPIKFLANGVRYKVTHQGYYGCSIVGLPENLNGQWVALVEATDSKHLNCIPPQELAKPEQTKCPRCSEVNPAQIHTCSPQVAQEPVKKSLRLKPHECLCGYSVGHPLVPKCICKPEYTAQPKREWIGLTDEEIDYIFGLAYADDMELLRTIEAKLKDKNG